MSELSTITSSAISIEQIGIVGILILVIGFLIWKNKEEKKEFKEEKKEFREALNRCEEKLNMTREILSSERNKNYNRNGEKEND